jgi:hypothetical protein
MVTVNQLRQRCKRICLIQVRQPALVRCFFEQPIAVPREGGSGDVFVRLIRLDVSRALENASPKAIVGVFGACGDFEYV